MSWRVFNSHFIETSACPASHDIITIFILSHACSSRLASDLVPSLPSQPLPDSYRHYTGLGHDHQREVSAT
jgi:hypothetical protein